MPESFGQFLNGFMLFALGATSAWLAVELAWYARHVTIIGYVPICPMFKTCSKSGKVCSAWPPPCFQRFIQP